MFGIWLTETFSTQQTLAIIIATLVGYSTYSFVKALA